MQRVFAALDSDVRRQILVYLASGALTFREISERFQITGPAVLRHLKILEDAGLVTRGTGKAARYAIVTKDLVNTFNAFLGTVHPRVSFEGHEERPRTEEGGASRSPVPGAATT